MAGSWEAFGAHGARTEKGRALNALKLRYAFAFALVALLVLVEYFAITDASRNQQRDAEVLNVASAQQMLTQRILLLANQAKFERTEEVRAARHREIEGLAGRMNASHRLLTLRPLNGQAPADMSLALRRHYRIGENGLDSRLRTFTQTAWKRCRRSPLRWSATWTAPPRSIKLRPTSGPKTPERFK